MTGLSDTISMMESSDYKERFRAEYFQVRIRTFKLEVMLNDWAAGNLSFTPADPRELLEAQLGVMKAYLSILEARAGIEGVELN